jgi:Zn-dependent alcohol dehydrogenase
MSTRPGATGIAIGMAHVLGADGTGIVVEARRNVASVKVNDKVCLYLFTGFDRCEFCLTGRDFCVFT